MDFGIYYLIVIGRVLVVLVLPVLGHLALDLGLALPPGPFGLVQDVEEVVARWRPTWPVG